MVSNSFNPFQMARQQFDAAAETLGLDDAVRQLLRLPEKEIRVQIPIRMDSGEYRVFQGFRVLHCSARGPGKGGVRFHPQETIDTVRALAMWETWKASVIDLPLGGSEGGVICDPHDLSSHEQEELCRGWVRKMARHLGPDIDVPGPDIMTTPRHMVWMLDEYENIAGKRSGGAVAGKPIGLGGSLGRTEAPGYGVVYTLREALKDVEKTISGTTLSLQGFGKVGRHVMELYESYGGQTIAVACWNQQEQKSFTFRKRDGLNYAELKGMANNYGEIDENKARDAGYEVLPGEAWIEQDVDVLVPAAMENQINADTVEAIRPSVKVVAEAANGPTTPEADEILTQKNILVIPDFLANAGGVVASYFEQVQSNMNYFWSRDEVLSKLDTKITDAWYSVSETAHRRNIPMREAAYLIAVTRVAEACKSRGWV